MNIHADGKTMHHFWGEYCATYMLKFADEELCKLAIEQLNRLDMQEDKHFKDACGFIRISGGWMQSDKLLNYALIMCSGEHQKSTEETLIKLGADKDKIGSLKYSIDWGEPFEVNIEIENPKQLQLLEK